MKKEYIVPSLKVMTIDMSSMIMTSGSAKTDIDWTSGESANVGLADFVNSNGESVDWDF